MQSSMDELLQSVETLQALDPEAYLSKFLQHNVRPSSSRQLHATRPTTILPSILTRNTHGSSLISIGNTRAISATTLQVGQPSPTTPHMGEIDISLHMGPLCHPRYDTMGRVLQSSSNHQSRDPLSIDSFVNRTVKQCSAIVDLSQLKIEEGKSAWKVHISILILNHDGNVEDVALLGAIVALADLELPSTTIQDDGKVATLPFGRKRKLELKCIPIPLSIGLLGDKMLVDPTAEEEDVLHGVLTIVMNEKGELLSVHKLGGKILSGDEMKACFALGKRRVDELVPVIKAVQEGNKKLR